MSERKTKMAVLDIYYKPHSRVTDILINAISNYIHIIYANTNLWFGLFVRHAHRGELTALQRSEQVARWVELTGGKQGVVSAQHAQKLGRPEGGISAATRELGIQRDDARRSIAVAFSVAACHDPVID